MKLETIEVMENIIFISHSCDDHHIACPLWCGLQKCGEVLMDPFDPGDKTCMKIQESIKKSTHFILLATPKSIISPWVNIEALFAQLCYDRNAIIYLPVSIDATSMLEQASELIYMKWKTSDGIQQLIKNLEEQISKTYPKNSLTTDVFLSRELMEEGRNLERDHAVMKNALFLHRAVKLYERAIDLNFCNHHAWINLAWTMWKLHEDDCAWKRIQIAQDINPSSKRVKDVKKWMKQGRRRKP